MDRCTPLEFPLPRNRGEVAGGAAKLLMQMKIRENVCRTKTEFDYELPGNQTDYKISRAPQELTRPLVWCDTDSRLELVSTLGIALQQRVIMISLPHRRVEVHFQELP